MEVGGVNFVCFDSICLFWGGVEWGGIEGASTCRQIAKLNDRVSVQAKSSGKTFWYPGCAERRKTFFWVFGSLALPPGAIYSVSFDA